MQMRTVRLLRKHTHAGKPVEKDGQLVLTESGAAWLVEQGVAEVVGNWAPQRAALLTPPEEMRAKDATKAPAAKPAARTGCCGPKWAR